MATSPKTQAILMTVVLSIVASVATNIAYDKFIRKNK